MGKFKVICKANGNYWIAYPARTKIVTTSKLFGLIKSTSVVNAPDWQPGPSKEEICIVHDTYVSGGCTYYKLLGYPNNGYNSKYFIRLDELEETSKEIAQKADLQMHDN